MFNILFNFHGLTHNCHFHHCNNFLFLHYDLIHFYFFLNLFTLHPGCSSSSSSPPSPSSNTRSLFLFQNPLLFHFCLEKGKVSHEYQENKTYQNEAKLSTSSLIKDGQGDQVRCRVPKASKTVETWAVSNSFLFLCLNYQIISMQQFS